MHSRREMRLMLATIITVFAIMVAGANAGDIYVDDDATGPLYDGTPGDPYKRITTALGAATSGDTIHVAAGLYDISHNGETFPLTMIDGVSIIGENRDTTILDAEDAAYHVIYCDSVSDLTIEGFTITGGNANGSSDEELWGGGIACWYSSPCIASNVITNNSAYTAGGILCWESSPTIENNLIASNVSSTGHAGGIYCSYSSPTIRNNEFQSNRAETYDGGAMFCSESSPTILNDTVNGNFAARSGGGIFCRSGSSPTIEDCVISCNSADCTGGGISLAGGSPIMTGCTITRNTAYEGGAIFFQECDSAALSSCEISDNTANIFGGGICCAYSSPTIDECLITSNYCTEPQNSGEQTTGSGAGICCRNSSPAIRNCEITHNETAEMGWGSGGIYCETNSNPTIDGCTITNNKGRRGGGGGACESSSPTLTNCTIDSNYAFRWGGGFFCIYASDPYLENCTLNYNQARDSAGGFLCQTDAGPKLLSCEISHNLLLGEGSCAGGGVRIGGEGNETVLIEDCIIKGNSGAFSGGGISMFTGELTMRRTTVASNITDAAGDQQKGGAIYSSSTSIMEIEECVLEDNESCNGGALYFANSSTFVNCVMQGNTASSYGGAIHCYGDYEPMVEDCVIVENHAQIGGAIYCADSCSPTLFNNLINGNAADEGAGLRCVDTSSPDLLNCTIADNAGEGASASGGSSPSLTNCIVWRNDDDLVGIASEVSYCNVEDGDFCGSDGNISEDPRFCSRGAETNYDGYFLKQESDEAGWPEAEWSPCVDTGDPSSNPFCDPTNTEYSTAVNGFLDTNTVDMGYHYKYFGCTFIQLLSFEAWQQGSSILLMWETGAEIDNAGFVLFRAVAGTSDYVQVSGLIPAEGTQASGASYSFTDSDVEAGTSYEYWLVDIDTSGKWRVHGPASARLPFGQPRKAVLHPQLPSADRKEVGVFIF